MKNIISRKNVAETQPKRRSDIMKTSFRKNLLRQIGMFSAPLVAALWMAACQKTTPVDIDSGEIELAKVPLAVKSAEEINANFSALTRVPISDNGGMNIVMTFANLKPMLTYSNEIGKINAAALSAMQKLATQYCSVATLSGTYRGALYPSITNYNVGAASYFADPASKSTVVQNLLARFYGQNLESNQDVQALFEGLVTELSVSTTENKNPSLINVLIGLCASILGSLPVSLK